MPKTATAIAATTGWPGIRFERPLFFEWFSRI
jgi:hypothetical protein